MKHPDNMTQRMDNGGRRRGIERREFSYSGHIPERRTCPDRRKGLDRRSGFDRREGGTPPAGIMELRSGLERRNGWSL